MAASITCICGYRGPGVEEAGQSICPICRTPAKAGSSRPASVGPVRPAPPPAPGDDGSDFEVGAEDRPATYRIPCPQGHVLKTTAAMLDQQVVCPKCNAVFVLRYSDSREHLKEQERAQHEREAEIATRWLRRAIWAAALILASLVGMIVYSFVYR
jgi:hypothetical protein